MNGPFDDIHRVIHRYQNEFKQRDPIGAEVDLLDKLTDAVARLEKWYQRCQAQEKVITERK